jgi:hypothetical protein
MKALKNKGLRQGVFQMEYTISSQGRYDGFDTSPAVRSPSGQCEPRGEARFSLPVKNKVSIPMNEKKVKPMFW